MYYVCIVGHNNTGWSNNSSGGTPDLTVLDPAIVSSGQLTDSRSDSPPHWMKTMEQQLSEGPLPLWNNLIPYTNHLTSAGPLPPPPPPSGLGAHHAGPTAPTQRSVAPMWPPTSPPPGFNTISPLHHPKQHEPHKIESKYIVACILVLWVMIVEILYITKVSVHSIHITVLTTERSTKYVSDINTCSNACNQLPEGW